MEMSTVSETKQRRSTGASWMPAALKIVAGEGGLPVTARLEALFVVFHNRFVKPILDCTTAQELQAKEFELVQSYGEMIAQLQEALLEIFKGDLGGYSKALAQLSEKAAQRDELAYLDEESRTLLLLVTDNLIAGSQAIIAASDSLPQEFIKSIAIHSWILDMNAVICWEMAMGLDHATEIHPLFQDVLLIAMKAMIEYNWVIKDWGIDINRFMDRDKHYKLLLNTAKFILVDEA